jgi:hypothetical protein
MVMPAPSNGKPAVAAIKGQASSREPWYRDVPGDVLLGAGIGALVAGGLLWKLGGDTIAEINSAAMYRRFDMRQSEGEDAERRQELGVGILIAGGVLVGAGVLRYVLREGHHGPGVAIVPALRGTGGELVVARSF